MADKKINEATFKELMHELEEITAAVETEEHDLEQSLKQFERGLNITKELQKRLQAAEQKINELSVPEGA